MMFPVLNMAVTYGEDLGLHGRVMAEKRSILEIKNINLNFGGLSALSGVNAEVKEHELLAIIGPNGAGKTSLFNCITGFYHPQEGGVFFSGKDITKMPSYKIAQMGIARTFQNIALYGGLSTLDNIMAARHIFMKTNFLTGAIYFGYTVREEVRHRRVVEEIIDFLEIHHIRKQVVANLPYGLRKRVDLGRALALEPQILLLDEPMAGMNIEEKEDMARFIVDIFETRRIPIVLVEHDMDLVMDLADRIIVLDFGRKIADGDPETIVKTPKVISAYLGIKETELTKS
jgi:branched-chain amino acid transport system ATP-binding protein